MNLLLAVAAENPSLLESVTKPFGWNPAFFFAQLVNFILVIFVLKKFAFGPIGKILGERRERILAAEEKVKLIERQLAESEITTAAAIAKANEDATRLINEAKESSAVLTAQKTQEAIASAQQILSKAETAAQAERAAIKAELKAEFGRLVAATTSQVTGKVLTADDQKRINEDALAKVEG